MDLLLTSTPEEMDVSNKLTQFPEAEGGTGEVGKSTKAKLLI